MAFNYVLKDYKSFYEFWLSEIKKKGISAYFVKFEDLVSDKKEHVLSEMMKYCLSSETIDGSIVQKRINNVVNKEKAGEIYKPRKGVQGNLKTQCSDDNIKHIQTNLRELMLFFGYEKS